MHVLLDANIPLNVMLDPSKRSMPEPSSAVMNALSKGKFIGYITPTSFSNMFYALKKERGQAEAVRVAHEVLDIVRITDQTESFLRNALAGGWSDTEDADQYFAAKANHRITHLCITNGKHYKKATGLKVVDPAHLLALLN